MYKLPKLIGICGKKRSGKDILANYLCNNYSFTNEKISEDLKNIIKILFGFTDNQLESNEKEDIDKSWGVSPRQTMKFIGTEIMQYKIQELLPNIKRNFWINSFIKKHIENQTNNIVISDLRFLHEYEALKKYNIYIIRLERDLENNEDNHISETEFLNIPPDVILSNNGTINDLYNKCDIIFNQK